MKRHLLFASALLVLALTSPGVRAGQTMEQLCAKWPCVYDANDKLVGFTAGFLFLRQIGGKWYQNVSYLSRTNITDGTYFYRGSDCTGQIYISDTGSVPPLVQYDGQAFFAMIQDTGGFDFESYSYPAKVNRGGRCVTYGPNCQGTGKPCHSFLGGLAGKALETIILTPPFKMQ